MFITTLPSLNRFSRLHDVRPGGSREWSRRRRLNRPLAVEPLESRLLLSLHTVLEVPLSEPSGGSQAGSRASIDGTTVLGPSSEVAPSGTGEAFVAAAATIGLGFEGFDFDDNATENGGFVFIPPDSSGAVGTDRVIAVVNTMIEARTKGGTLLYRDSLQDFFSPLTPLNATFDPKVVYDQYEDRFVAVTMERVDAGSNPNAGNMSRILLAVSKTGTPATATAADWEYHAINSETSIGGVDHWADYPGFEVDEEAIYIAANMFPHPPTAPVMNISRLWIVDKGTTGGFYDGGAAAVTFHNPYAGGGSAATTMPCQVFGAGGIGPGIGTFLVSYSGLTVGGAGGSEFVQVVRVDNPLGATAFTQENVNIGDLEDIGGGFGFPALPDAPQMGTGVNIEVNDRRALDCVARDGSVWLTTTINPNAGPDAGQTTAHWFELDTSAVPAAITLDDQGNIGGEDIAPGTFTFFPSVAVNSVGTAQFGFSGSAPTIFAGAFVTGREASDAAGTVQASATVHAGEDFYIRTFGGPRNRWGDYSGIALDPINDDLFWVFNQYAATRGTIIGGEDGRWGTAWASSTFAPSGSPVDVYILVDLSGSFSDDIANFKIEAPAVIDTLLASNPNTKFGLGSFEDYPIAPFGDASFGDVAYRRDIDLIADPTGAPVKAVIAGLVTRSGGDLPQSQLPALFQAATGNGQVVAGFPVANIPANQQANFRNGATKLFLLWTDASFHLPGDAGPPPYPGPSFVDTVNAILALDPPKVIGIASGSDPGAIADLEAMAMATDALAPPGGVDCDGDETIDILEGEPLVCSTVGTGEGIGDAILAAVVAGTTISVDLDVIPKKINLKNKGVTPVAILGSETFSVVSVNPATLQFGPAGAPPAHDVTDPSVLLEHFQDVNNDGFLDFMTHYRTQDTGIECGDTSAILTGKTFNDQPIEGSDSIKLTKCNALEVEVSAATKPLSSTVEMISETLSRAMVNSAVDHALTHWTAVGVDAQQMAVLTRTDVQISDLSGSLLGLADVSSNTIWLDGDAASYGWSMDTQSVGVNLVSALTHEFGHLLGFDHGSNHDVMAPTLAPVVSGLSLPIVLADDFHEGLLSTFHIDLVAESIFDPVELPELHHAHRGTSYEYRGRLLPDESTARLLFAGRSLLEEELLDELARDLLQNEPVDLLDAQALLQQQRLAQIKRVRTY